MTVSFIVLVDDKVGEFYLTDDNGLLFVSKGQERVLRPQDEIHFDACGTVTAADLVITWVRQSNRIPAARQAAEAFLRKWPDGPQLGGIFIEMPDTTHQDGLKIHPKGKCE
jgi:hypothetical protein